MERMPSQLQSDLVNAFLDQFEHDEGWSVGFIHAEFPDPESGIGPFCQAFLVRRPADPDKPDYVALDWPIVSALIALQAGYAEIGQAPQQIDIEIEAGDGRYRIEFSDEPSSRLAGQADPLAKDRLLRRYRDIVSRS